MRRGLKIAKNKITIHESSFFFQISGRFYRQREEIATGNPLLPFIDNLFMNNFETKMKGERAYFPWVCLRYVDDILAIFNTAKFSVRDFLKQLNSKFKFTMEEVNKQLPFLDSVIIRHNNKLQIGFYRKATKTHRFASADPNRCIRQKVS